MSSLFKTELTFEDVKKRLGCPDPLANYIINKVPRQEREKKVIELEKALKEIAEYAGDRITNYTARYLGDEKISEIFSKNPRIFVAIASSFREDTRYACLLFVEEDIVKLFYENPSVVAGKFRAVAETTKDAERIFLAVKYEDRRIREMFLDYCKGKIKLELLLVNIYSRDSTAIEMGTPLDGLHNNEKEREEALKKFSTLQVLGLLLSDPEYFYTSTNQLLFNKLIKDLREKHKTISGILKEYNLLETESGRNFLFRALRYDRLYGKPNSLLNESEVKAVLDTLINPIGSDRFDGGYFFILANGLNDLNKIQVVKDSLIKKINERLKQLQEKKHKTQDEGKILSALEFLTFKVDPATTMVSSKEKHEIKKLDRRTVFRQKDYREGSDFAKFFGKGGKATVLQIFDTEDTEGDWLDTQQWFGVKKRWESGKVVAETENAKVILFKGKNTYENQEFIKNQLKENPNRIITFRGHSYRLAMSFPSDIFGNRKGISSSFQEAVEARAQSQPINQRIKTQTSNLSVTRLRAKDQKQTQL